MLYSNNFKYRVKCIVSYDGTNYYGFQVQESKDTVELEIETAISKLYGEQIKIYASGRTDRFVHARGQVFHFDTNKNIVERGIKKGLNSFLPTDIEILDVSYVDESFHSRFSVKKKEYRYYIKFQNYSVFDRNYYFNAKNLDVIKMQEAMKLFCGKHNFKGFCSAKVNPNKSFVKEVYDAHINVYSDYYEFIFIGSGFLKYQIRRMMGIIVEIGLGREDKNKIIEVLEKQDPRISHKCLPGCGLFLERVEYE